MALDGKEEASESRLGKKERKETLHHKGKVHKKEKLSWRNPRGGSIRRKRFRQQRHGSIPSKRPEGKKNTPQMGKEITTPMGSKQTGEGMVWPPNIKKPFASPP